MERLTFFKLQSSYKEDYTKNCQLTAAEVDQNFLTLKDFDIKTAYWVEESQTLMLVRNNNEIIPVTGITEGCTKDLEISFNAGEGTLTVSHNGTSTILTGFTGTNCLSHVYSDETLSGSGAKCSPLGVSPAAQTGVYRPAFRFIDTTVGENLPHPENLTKGDRYLTLENSSAYGLLYNYQGVKNLMNDLACQGSEWRVPSKEDWDGMLDAVEPCAEDKNHTTAQSNRYLGRFAGKLLKSAEHWKLEDPYTPPCPPPFPPCPPCPPPFPPCPCVSGETSGLTGSYVLSGTTEPCVCNYPSPKFPCPPVPPVPLYPNKGVDAFGFTVMPAGYADGSQVVAYFGERAYFWTSTTSYGGDVYTKRFDYNRSTVYQEIMNPNNMLSLRLVKDYDGTNFTGKDRINGMEYETVLLPDARGGYKIWTMTNVAFTHRHYFGIEPNNGINLFNIEKFFANEWDGFKWVKNEVKEGESIVLLNTPDGKHNLEYRVINGALISVGDAVYEEVMNTVQPQIDNLSTRVDVLKLELTNVSAKLDSEINRAMEADKNLDAKIDAEIERSKTADQNLDAKIDAETQRSIEADNNLDAKINAEVERSTQADINLDNKITEEINRAVEADKNLDAKIDAETQRSMEADQALDNKITEETNRAIESETNLDNKITEEINRSIEADNNLDAKIDAETQRSIEADTNLDNKITEEINRSVETDKQIIGRLISPTGSIYNLAQGTLTLATDDPANTITIKLDGNYGTF